MRTGGPVTVLISSAGRRVELLRVPPGAGGHRGRPGRVLATDCSWYSSAFHDADEAFLVPRLGDPEFVPRLSSCVKHRVDLVVPTIDTEMPVWVAHRDRFDEIGTTIALSHGDLVAIAADKQGTHDWLVAQGFTVEQTTPAGALADPDAWTFPLMAKPRFGSAGLGVGLVRDARSWRWSPAGATSWARSSSAGGARRGAHDRRAGRPHGPLRVRRAPPPHRGRAGEVSKGVTVRSAVLEDLAVRLREALPGAYGALNVQVFVDDPDHLAVIEINARYGGGFPLSLEAGADFPRWMLEELLGLPSTASPDGWRAGLVMLRYDAAVFVDEDRRDE